ncbi:MAG: hypothetical protein QMC80_01455 [Thermoplasmatales archaeon]|nr:hypothetical protein [Thermoplasmatales archaeon]
MEFEENADSAIDERYRKRFGETLHEEPGMLGPVGSEGEPVTLEPVEPGAEPVVLEPVKPRTKSTLSGVLLIVAGMLAIITWGYSAFILGFPLISVEPNTLIVFAIAGSVFAVFAVIAGIMASVGKNWKTCVVFSLLGILSIGFLVSSILCLIAFIGLLMAKKEFD